MVTNEMMKHLQNVDFEVTLQDGSKRQFKKVDVYIFLDGSMKVYPSESVMISAEGVEIDDSSSCS